MFLPATREPDPGDMYTFFYDSFPMGGRVPDQGPMINARVIHVERSVTPIIFAIFHNGLYVFFKNGSGKKNYSAIFYILTSTKILSKTV